MRRPPLGRPAGRGAPAAGRRGTTGTSEAAGGGICILRGGPWPPIDVIEPRLPAECSDWFEAIRLRTATSGGVGTSSDGGGAKAAAVGFEAWALTRCVWTCVEIKILRCVLLDGVAMPAPRRSTEPGRPRHRRSAPDTLVDFHTGLDDDGTGRRDRRRAHRSEAVREVRIIFIRHGDAVEQRRQGVGRRCSGRVPDGTGLALGPPRLVGRGLPCGFAVDLFSSRRLLPCTNLPS